jgi:hypothetical protein
MPLGVVPPPSRLGPPKKNSFQLLIAVLRLIYRQFIPKSLSKLACLCGTIKDRPALGLAVVAVPPPRLGRNFLHASCASFSFAMTSRMPTLIG